MTKTQQIDEWVYQRRGDLLAREFDNSLRSVGPDKPLGQLAFPLNLRGLGSLLLANVRARLRGLGTAFVNDDDLMRLYVWHPVALSGLLSDHQALLRLVGAPLEPMPFIDWIRDNVMGYDTPMYELVADVYGDKLNPLRQDVLPDVDEKDLLDAYSDRFGEPDPTMVYYLHANRPEINAGALECMFASLTGAPTVPPPGIPTPQHSP